MAFKQFLPTSWSLDNKTSIYVFTLIISLAGILIYNALPKERFPDIVVPTIVVSTIYPGTSPEDVENLVTKQIEKQLKSTQGVKKVTSNSISDYSLVMVEFNTGVDVPVAKQRVQDAVDKARTELPTDMDNDPSVQEVDFSEFPIMQVNIVGDYPLDKLKKFAEMLQDEIEGLPEITRADMIGALEREIQVDVDIYRMQAAGLSFNDISQAISGQNINVSGGELRVDQLRRTLRVTGEFKKATDLDKIVVRGSRGQSLFLSEIAEVKDGFAEKQNYARLDGKGVITLNIIKRSGENLINASTKIEELVTRLKAEKFPAGVKISITGDQAEFTKGQLNELVNSVVIGFVFVVLVLMFFMGVTNAFFVGLSVPISVLIAFLLMPGLDYSLNMIVMFSFLLALGIVVDDAIVVIENTHRLFHDHPEWGVLKAAKVAAGEMFAPVLSGTLTTIAPFFPLLFWPGLIGEFMKYLPVTLIITLFASLFTAFIINPVFAATFMKNDEENNARTPLRIMLRNLTIMGILTGIGYQVGPGWGNFMVLVIFLYLLNEFVLRRAIDFFQQRMLPAFMNAYRSLLSFLIRGIMPYVVVVFSVVLLIFTFIMMGVKTPPIVFFPDNEPNFVYVYVQLPIGTDASVTDSVTAIAERRVMKVLGAHNPIVKSVISNVGVGAGEANNPDRTITPHKGKVSVAFVEYKHRNGVSTKEYLSQIRTEVGQLPGVQVTVDKESGGPPTQKPINIEIAGEDFKVLFSLEKQVREAIAKAGIRGIEELKSDLQLNKPEILIEIDREKASREGISVGQIAMEVRGALYGKEASKLRDTDDEYKIMVRAAPKYRNKLETLLNVEIAYLDMASGQFRQIPLNSLVKVHYTSSYSSINRKNQQRTNTVSSNVLAGYNANEIVGELKTLFSNIQTPAGYTIKLTGEQEQQEETGTFLFFALFGAIGLIFLILVTQFNSVSKPLIILATVLLSLIGVLLGFIIFGDTISIVMTGVGIIALAGIVVKNGILLIEFMDELRGRGMELRTAIIQAGSIRLTPVLLTAASTVLGLVPLAMGVNINFSTLFTRLDPEFFVGGDSALFWGPLAWAIIYGLTFASFLTLLVVPSMYYISESLKLWLKRGKATTPAQSEEVEEPTVLEA